MNNIEIKPVTGKRGLKQFIKLPWKIYAGDPLWVPPLILDMKNILNQKKNPFFEHSQAEYFLALRDGEPVGRIAAIINGNHNAFHEEKTGFFGFFESVNDTEVSGRLLETAREWVASRGMNCLRGPMNFSTNDTCGLLSEGFDSAPVIMMTYNPEYYLRLMQAARLKKVKDLYAYSFSAALPIPERFVKFAEKALADESLSFRTMNMREFNKEVDTIMSIYNDAWEKNWGFVPMTEKEFRHAATDLKAAVDPSIVFIAEVNGEPAGFALTIPDYNEILKDINGRLLPFGIFKLLLNKKKIKRLRVVTLGVRQKFQKKRGLAPAFYYKTYMEGRSKGYAEGEFSWILEDNTLMNRAAEGLGAKLYKKYTVYEAPV